MPVRAVFLAAALLLAVPAYAQTSTAPAAARPDAARTDAEARPPLPADSVTQHTLSLPGRTLHFTATAGAFRLTDAQGKPQADIAYTSYTLDGADPSSRPVAFAVNGGPGASSAWLQLGAMGPWRLALQGPPTPSAPPVPTPNAETWLDFADLVFIDPPGTGFSRLATSAEELRHKFYAVEGDIPPLAEVIRRWTVRQARTASPRLIVGESYGGFRGPRLVHALQTGEGLGVTGLVMVSPVLDFAWTNFGTDPMSLAGRLPSMAAVAAETAGHEPDLAAAEQYAATDFLADLLRGPRDAAAVDRLTSHVAALTGLDPALVRRRAGRIDLDTFQSKRLPGEITSLYDGTIASPDATPTTPWHEQPDAVLDALRAPLTSTMLALYQILGWQPEGQYQGPERGRGERLGLGAWVASPEFRAAIAHRAGARPRAAGAGGARARRSGDPLFRDQAAAGANARNRRARPGAAAGHARRAHAVFARCQPGGIAGRRAGAGGAIRALACRRVQNWACSRNANADTGPRSRL